MLTTEWAPPASAATENAQVKLNRLSTRLPSARSRSQARPGAMSAKNPRFWPRWKSSR